MQFKLSLLRFLGLGYQRIVKRILFLFDPELVHERMTANGELMGNIGLVKAGFSLVTNSDNSGLTQDIAGIHFKTPIGLSAGFDYNAQLTGILPSLGFGYGSIGTITRYPYEGNPRPRLGRLPRSRSLMVNKGFRNLGSRRIIQKLEGKHFSYPVGVSIGRTNTTLFTSLSDAINDIQACFSAFEDSYMHHAYYELNISCPNLLVDISFYETKVLTQLLRAVTGMHLSRPLFIKMPIDKSDAEVKEMLDVIVQYPVAGIIIGNLQKKRDVPALVPEEVAKFKVGNFSGKATWDRSNELIALAYKHVGKKLTIIGCGGVFCAEDAYTKIKLGASLIQMITGMIFQGPFVVAQMNHELAALLKRDGYKHISEAVGVASR